MAIVNDLIVNGSARFIGIMYGSLSGNAATATALTTNAGSATQPVYFSGGKPVATTYTLGKSVPSNAVFTDTTYSAGAGLTLSGTQFKHSNSVTAATAAGDASKTLTFGGTFTIPTISYDAQGHVTGKGTTTMTMPANPNTDTHWITGITAGETGTTSNSATTNGNTFIKIKDNSTHRGQIKLVGSGATSISSNAEGVITVSSTDNNTTYGSMSVSEGTTGTATANRVLTAANLKGIINAHAPTKTGGGASGTWGISISGNAASASKVNNKLTVGSKSYDGSSAITIAASDLGLASAMLFLGTTTTAITDGATTNPVAISGANKTVAAGNVVLYGSKEFVWTGSAWEELGNEGSYKIVQAAVADPSASGTSNTFIDTISQDTNGKITVTKKTVAATNSAPTLAWGATSTIGTVAGTNLQVKMPANPNTDTKVTQTVTTSNAAYPLLLAPNGQTDTTTTTSYFDSGVTLNPSTNTIAANVSGNAATATKLATARTIWGQSFNGTANISGNMTGVVNINTAAAPAGTVYMNNWFRSTGSTGWYNETYGGGWYMTDSTYIRNYNSKTTRLDNLCLGADNNSYRLYVNGTSYQTDIARFVKTGTAAVFGGTVDNIDSAIYAPTTGIQLCADSGGATNSTAIGFHNPGISSAIFGYYQIDANNGQFRMRSDDTYWDLSLGGTIKLSTPWGKANLLIGEDGYDKIVAGYLVSSTNGAVIGAHNSALTKWSPLNVSGSTINFREDETIRGKILDGCLSLFPSNSNYREGIRIHATGSWSDILLCGNDNTGDSGTSANSWFLGNNNGNFYITRNGSTSSTASYASVVNNYWQFYPKLGINGQDKSYNFYVNGNTRFQTAVNQEVIISGRWMPGVAVTGNQDGNDRPGLRIFGDYPQMVLMSGRAGNASHGATISLGGFDDPNAVNGSFKMFTIGTPGYNVNFMDIGYGTSINPHANGMNAYVGTRIMRFNSDGTVQTYNKLYGAVWNDYAEFRQSDITEPGRIVIENGDGTLSLSTQRLQRGAEVISDTYGFAIGETDECKTPIAVSGRVLAYYSGDIKEFKPGYPVCSGPNGTVSVMTEEEEEKYPSRIIGTVSEIPTYEKWGTGNVEVNGRIWIRIR